MIPEIDVRANVARKMFEGTLTFSFEADEDILDIPFVRFAGHVAATLGWVILADNKTVEVSGTLDFALEGACSRCLAETHKDFLFEADASFAPDAEEEEYAYVNGKIVLKEFLRDSLIFALPSRLLCKSCEQWEKE